MAREQTYAQLVLAEEMLADGRPFLLGAAPTVADCALYNPVWFLKERLGAGKAVPPLDRLPRIVAWSERMKAFGSGTPTEMTSDASARCRQGGDPGSHSGRRQRSKRAEGRPDGQHHAGRHRQGAGDGRRWSGSPADRSRSCATIARVGDVVVHFPRAGFVVTSL